MHACCYNKISDHCYEACWCCVRSEGMAHLKLFVCSPVGLPHFYPPHIKNARTHTRTHWQDIHFVTWLHGFGSFQLIRCIWTNCCTIKWKKHNMRPKLRHTNARWARTLCPCIGFNLFDAMDFHCNRQLPTLLFASTSFNLHLKTVDDDFCYESTINRPMRCEMKCFRFDLIHSKV